MSAKLDENHLCPMRRSHLPIHGHSVDQRRNHRLLHSVAWTGEMRVSKIFLVLLTRLAYLWQQWHLVSVHRSRHLFRLVFDFAATRPAVAPISATEIVLIRRSTSDRKPTRQASARRRFARRQRIILLWRHCHWICTGVVAAGVAVIATPFVERQMLLRLVQRRPQMTVSQADRCYAADALLVFIFTIGR